MKLFVLCHSRKTTGSLLSLTWQMFADVKTYHFGCRKLKCWPFRKLLWDIISGSKHTGMGGPKGLPLEWLRIDSQQDKSIFITFNWDVLKTSVFLHFKQTVHIKMTSAATLERKSSDISLSKICSFSSTFVCCLSRKLYNATLNKNKIKTNKKYTFVILVRWSITIILWALPVLSSEHFLFATSCSSTLPLRPSVDFLNFPDDLLLEDRQHGVVLAHLFEHHPAIELVADLLEIKPKRSKQQKCHY